MGKRIKAIQSQKTRDKIRAALILDRLERFALGERTPAGNEVDMSAAQVKAAQILLGKILPDMVHNLQEEVMPTESVQQKYDRLVNLLGAGKAAELYPDFSVKEENDRNRENDSLSPPFSLPDLPEPHNTH